MGRIKGSDYQVWLLRRDAEEMFKGGVEDAEIASRLNRKVSTIQRWRREMKQALATEIIQESMDDSMTYRRMAWLWTAEMTRIKAEIRTNPTIVVTKMLIDPASGEESFGDEVEANMMLVDELSHAISERRYWQDLWTPNQIAATRAAVARETQGTTQGLPPQLSFPGVEEWYAMIRGYRRISPALAGREDITDENEAKELDDALDAWGKAHGQIKLPTETF